MITKLGSYEDGKPGNWKAWMLKSLNAGKFESWEVLPSNLSAFSPPGFQASNPHSISVK
jgi:hypothetical protein